MQFPAQGEYFIGVVHDLAPENDLLGVGHFLDQLPTLVEDIIQGVRAAIDYDRSIYEVFNLGESQTTELKDLISLLERSLDAHAIIDHQPTQPGDVPITFADISKSKDLLGYNPTTKIVDGIPKFVEWFRSSRSC